MKRCQQIYLAGLALVAAAAIPQAAAQVIFADDFDDNTNTGWARLASDEWFDFDVIFSPTSIGSHSALITIDSDAAENPAFIFTVDALAQPQSEPQADPEPELVILGGDPMVRVLRNDTSPSPSPSPASGTDAGSVLVGEALQFKFRARNRGDARLALRSASAIGAPVTADDLVGQLDPGEHDDFTLTFVPPNAGTYLFPIS